MPDVKSVLVRVFLVRIFATDNHPSRIYFEEKHPNVREERGDGIRHLGVQTAEADPSVYQHEDSQDRRHRYPDSLIPSKFPSEDNTSWNYTHCRLENVSEIACCLDQAQRDNSIIGMLLSYEDGRRACVGQYRPDWAGPRLRVDPGSSLWIRKGSQERDHQQFIAEVCLEAPPEPDSVRWMEIPWRGRLEWVEFWRGVSELHHYE